MIKKSLITAVVLFALYSVAVEWVPNDYPIKGQSPYQNNMIKAQEFIAQQEGIDHLLVGSSLGNRIRKELLPQEFYNLSFQGQSIYEGLEIIKQSGATPKTILIETNVVDRPARPDFVNNLFTPVVSDARKNVRSLRERFQPITLLISYFYARKQGTQPTIMKVNANYPGSEPKEPDTSKSFMAALEQNNSYGEIRDQKVLNKNLALLREYIDYFQAKEVKILFYEMPIDQRLCDLPMTSYMREQMGNVADEKGIDFIRQPDCSHYMTTDGIHLNEVSAGEYSAFLLAELQKNKLTQQ